MMETCFLGSMLPHLQNIAEEADAARVIAQNFRLLEKASIVWA